MYDKYFRNLCCLTGIVLAYLILGNLLVLILPIWLWIYQNLFVCFFCVFFGFNTEFAMVLETLKASLILKGFYHGGLKKYPKKIDWIGQLAHNILVMT